MRSWSAAALGVALYVVGGRGLDPLVKASTKARGLPLKRPVCATCIDRTRRRTEEIRVGYRVTVWLWPGHASQAFPATASVPTAVQSMVSGNSIRPSDSRQAGRNPSVVSRAEALW